MRNIILAATAAIILAAGTAPSFADNGAAQQGSSNIEQQCANINANPTGYPASMVAYCGNSDPGAAPLLGGRIHKTERQGVKKRHDPSAIRTAPVMRDDGPTIALPG
jgi:hypothetical protein